MQSLKYTNFLLTVIAICLIYQCVKLGSAPVTAAAAPAPTKVEIVNKEVPVEVKSIHPGVNKVPVEIYDVRYGIAAELPVRVKN